MFNLQEICAERSNILLATWKMENISPTEAIKFANEWKSKDMAGKIKELYVRKCSKGQIGITMKYEMSEGDKSEFNQFVYVTTDKFRKQFGNKFVGHDISGPVWVI